MKNLKKVLALVVVFAMMLSTVAFAGSFPDVADDADYASAIETLAAMGFFKGDDNGNFNPDATITRAEYAVIVCRLLGIEGSATGKCDFTDAADHWATGYIKMANQYGIVKGYGDGNFGPDDAVKYEEAVKMLVCALGYEPMATSKGGYPTGYIAVASQIGLLDGVSGAAQGTGAARNIVATMTYNALDIPVMEQTGFGTDISYEIMKENDDHDKATLLTKMGIYKLGGTVDANSKVGYGVEKVNAGQISFTVDDDYDCPEKALRMKVVNGNDKTYTKTFEVGNTNAEEFVGTKAIIYVAKESGKWVVKAVEMDNDSTSTLTIKASDLNDDERHFNDSKPSFRYYKDGATSGTGTKVNLSYAGTDTKDYAATWNNKSVTAAELQTNLKSSVSAMIELIDKDNDTKYDIVKVYEYLHMIARSYDENKGTIETYNGSKIDLAIDDDDKVVTIKDVNGNEIAASDIADGDVLAIIVDATSDKPWDIKETSLKNADKYESLDITVLKNSTVTGVVKEYDKDKETGDIVVSIDGKDYDVDSKEIYNKSKIDLQAEGTFYIGINGEIVGFEGENKTSDNFAFIMNAYTSGKNTNQMELLTKDGKTVTYDLASSIRFANPNYGLTGETTNYIKKDIDKTVSTTVGDSGYIKDLTAMLKNTTWEGLFKDAAGSVSIREQLGSKDDGVFYNNIDEALKETGATKEKIAAARFITYKLNSNNEIVEIKPASTKKANVEGTNSVDFGKEKDVVSGTYKASGQKVGTKLLNDNIVVFKLDWTNPSSSKVTDVSYFVDDSQYTALLYNKNDDSYYGAAVILTADAVFEDGAGLAIVESKRDTKDDADNDITKVTAYKDGETVELTFDDDSNDKGGNVAPGSFDVGTVIMYNANAEGLVSDYAVVGTTKNREFTFASGFSTADGVKFGVDDDDAFYYGYIKTKTTNDNEVTINVKDSIPAKDADNNDIAGTDRQFTVGKANQYTVTGTSKKTTISEGSYTYGDVDAYLDSKGEVSSDKVYYVLIRTFDGDVVDIVSFDKGQTLKAAEPKVEYTATVQNDKATKEEALATLVVTKKVGTAAATTLTKDTDYTVAVADIKPVADKENTFTVTVTIKDKDNTKVTSNEFTIKVADGGEIELPSADTESVEEDAVVKDADILPSDEL